MADRADKRLVRCEVDTHTEGLIMKDRYALCNRMVTRTEESSTAFSACTTPPAKHTRSPARISCLVLALPCSPREPFETLQDDSICNWLRQLTYLVRAYSRNCRHCCRQSYSQCE